MPAGSSCLGLEVELSVSSNLANVVPRVRVKAASRVEKNILVAQASVRPPG